MKIAAHNTRSMKKCWVNLYQKRPNKIHLHQSPDLWYWHRTCYLFFFLNFTASFIKDVLITKFGNVCKFVVDAQVETSKFKHEWHLALSIKDGRVNSCFFFMSFEEYTLQVTLRSSTRCDGFQSPVVDSMMIRPIVTTIFYVSFAWVFRNILDMILATPLSFSKLLGYPSSPPPPLWKLLS